MKSEDFQPTGLGSLVRVPVLEMDSPPFASLAIAQRSYSDAHNADVGPDFVQPKPACSYCGGHVRLDGFCHSCRKWGAE